MATQQFGGKAYHTAPFIRLLVPFIAGILGSYHWHIPLLYLYALGIAGSLLLLVYTCLTLSCKYRLRWLTGLAFTLLLTCAGGVLAHRQLLSNHANWAGHTYHEKAMALVTLQEPLADKPKSYKAIARIQAMQDTAGNWQPVTGNLLLYFKKDSTKPAVDYGSQLLITNIQPINNAGNPGGFDYARYCAFQGIYYQAFLADKNFVTLPTLQTNAFDKAILTARNKVLFTLRNCIANKDALGIAEALLIGYRDDLDRDLVKAYSNTGVVHIIAISGLHLGMIYGLLLLLFKPFAQRRWVRILKPLTIITVLWGFTFLAGAMPSIVRSAVMFTILVLGEAISRKSNMYNSLAASAFLILASNPYSLWDVGFQLSYTAVLSIVVFQRYIRNWFYFQNKLLATLWNLSAVTLAAQILTLPVVLYHFHQFPLLFLLTNLLIVPLSGLILYAEMLLLLVADVCHGAAVWLGICITKLIQWMNDFVLYTNSLDFTTWPAIQITITQAILLFGCIAGISSWLIQHKNKALIVGLSCFGGFMLLRSLDFIQRNTQQKMIVYNVPSHTAIDVIQGRQYCFIGDSVLQQDGFLQNFHIKPSRILHRTTPAQALSNIAYSNQLIVSNSKRVVLLNQPLPYQPPAQKIKADVIIVTGNPKLYMKQVAAAFDCPQLVFDGTNPFWKIRYWKKDADSLHLRHHTTATQGAFEMDL